MLIILIMGKSLGQMLHIDNSGNMVMTMDGLTIQKDASGNTQLNLDGLIISRDPSDGAIDYGLVKNKPVIREADLKVQVPVGTMMSYIGNDYIEDPTFLKPGTIVNRNDYIELANTIGIPKSQTTFMVPSMPTDWDSITNNPFTTSNGIAITNTGTDTGLVVNQKVIGDVVDFKYQDTSIFKIADGGNVGIGTNRPLTGVDMSNTTSSLVIPTGNINQRPTTNIPGQIRQNNFHNTMETYNGVTWNSLPSSALPPIDNMMVYWDAGNSLSYPGSGNIVNSLVSPNITGTLNNVTVSNGVFEFNGVNSYIDATLNNPSGAWVHSISFWMLLNQDQGSAPTRIDPFQIGSVATTSKYSALDFGNGSLNWYFYGNDASYTGNIFKKDVWYHVVLTYNGGFANNFEKLFYVNTVSYPLTSSSTTALNIDANAVMSIGRDRTRNYGYFPGKIANFQIFNRVLTPVEITNMYHTMKPRFNIPIWYAPGTILQYIFNQQYTASSIYISGASNWDTGISVRIVPKFATSKILIKFSTTMTHLNNMSMNLTLFRNGIEATNRGYKLSYESNPSAPYYPGHRHYIDSPNTTAPLTYQIYVASGTGYVLHNDSWYILSAEEIAQ